MKWTYSDGVLSLNGRPFMKLKLGGTPLTEAEAQQVLSTFNSGRGVGKTLTYPTPESPPCENGYVSPDDAA